MALPPKSLPDVRPWDGRLGVVSCGAIRFSLYGILDGHEHTSPGHRPGPIRSEAIALVFLFGHAGLTLLGKGIWNILRTLLFPLLGWRMDPGFSQDLSFWELLRWNIYLYSSHWGLLIPELAGLAYLAYLGVRLSLRAQTGRIGARIPQPPQA